MESYVFVRTSYLFRTLFLFLKKVFFLNAKLIFFFPSSLNLDGLNFLLNLSSVICMDGLSWIWLICFASEINLLSGTEPELLKTRLKYSIDNQ